VKQAAEVMCQSIRRGLLFPKLFPEKREEWEERRMVIPNSATSSLRIQTRQHSHALEKKGLSSDNYPSRVFLQIVSVKWNDVKMKKAARVQLAMRANKKTVSAMPFAHTVVFDLNFHTLMFDLLKLNVQIQKLILHENVAQASIKWSQLETLHGELSLSCPLVDFSKKHLEIGEIKLKIIFEFGSYEKFNRTLASLDMRMVDSPLSTKSLFSSTSDVTTLSRAGSLDSSRNLNKLIDKDDSIDDMMTYYANVDNVMHSEASFDSRSKLSRSDSTLTYRKKTAKEGFQILNQLWAAMTSTGWRISRADFARGIAMIQAYGEYYPTPKTFDVVNDDEFLRIGAYFLPFTIGAYGALLIQYFGYGTVGDLLKLDNQKACIALLKMDKKYMLEWQYDSHGLFDHKPCFYVCYDEATESIVLAIRGTLGIADALTDLNAEYSPFMGGSAHEGSLHSALWIRGHYSKQLKKWIKQHKAKALYLVGHSLGGSVATILLMLIRDEFKEKFGKDFEIQVYGYASPPCLSYNLIDEYKPDVYTFINEYDIIPKISYGSIMDFKDLLSHAAKLAKDSTISKMEKLESINQLQQTLKVSNIHPKLLIPGKLFFMYKTNRIDPSQKISKIKDLRSGNPLIDDLEPHYVVERSVPEHFDDLHIRLDMFFNHFLNKYDNSLRKAIDWLVEYKRK
jgi:hypothetical protein